MVNLLRLFRKYNELCFWIIALLFLFFMNPGNADETFCLFHWIGINWCPGCGIGHSIHYALHLKFAESFRYHPIGIIAVLIILHRIKQLFFLPKQLVS